MKKSLVVVTFNRLDVFKKSIQSMDITLFDKIVVVHDGGGDPYPEKIVSALKDRFEYIPMKTNAGVGVCKQTGIDWILANSDAEHIFVVEDDVVVTDNGVWDFYINFSKHSGIWHTNWNDCQYSSIKFELDFDGNRGIVTRDVAGSFSYFHRNMFKFCSFPPDMKNAFEHVSVELQLIERDLLPPFWNFVCPKDTGKYLKNADAKSTITGSKTYTENYQKSMQAFKLKHKRFTNDIPDVEEGVVLERCKFLKETYSKNDK